MNGATCQPCMFVQGKQGVGSPAGADLLQCFGFTSNLVSVHNMAASMVLPIGNSYPVRTLSLQA